jgi:hypothetical protein
MSTNSECLFIQTKPDEWFYVLEHRNAPKNAWDWRENASAYGPFTTEDQANEHLRNNHANPGGSTTEPLPDGVFELNLGNDKLLQELLADAPKNTRNRYG